MCCLIWRTVSSHPSLVCVSGGKEWIAPFDQQLLAQQQAIDLVELEQAFRRSA